MSAGLPELDLPRASNGINGNASVHKMPSTSTMGLGEDEDITFESPEEEAHYYRDKYRRALDLLEETRNELDEFQASSKELEDELERELGATEKQQAELKDRIQRLETEKDEWKAKHVAVQKMHSSTVGAMQREMDNLKSERDKTLVALRDLEMGNDELERNERVAVSSLLDLESKYNRAIEEKTLLEQEVVQKQEIEEELQRMKDDLRDANSEISILRDQVARAVPTPPSSVSVHMSPLQEATHEDTLPEIPSLISEAPPSQAAPPLPPKSAAEAFPRSPAGLVRSSTLSSIPTLSPSANRRLPTTTQSLARSTTSRNLASPSLARSRSGLPQPSSPAPAPRVVSASSNLAAKTKGVKLLRELQARLKATDDKLAKRTVSGPKPLAPRVQQETPAAGDRTNATFLSPNGWVMIEDDDDDATPPHQLTSGFPRPPDSPLSHHHHPQQRAVSAASTSSSRLPTRPGIPSPLASLHTSQLGKSTSSRQPNPPPPQSRPPSRTTMLTNTNGTSSRPMSPSMLPRSSARAASPAAYQPLAISTSTSQQPTSRPSSRQQLRSSAALGRGPPPSASVPMKFPTHHPLGMSISGHPTPPPPSSSLRRSTRRSSLGAAEASLPPTGIPAPKASPGGRPVSVPVFARGEAPPVPRIPSGVLRESRARKEGIGAGDKERPRTMFER